MARTAAAPARRKKPAAAKSVRKPVQTSTKPKPAKKAAGKDGGKKTGKGTAPPTRKSAAKPRGRPPAAPETHAAIRQRLLDATRTVFTRTGYHGLSVERVLAEAKLSRPTFYKHFRNTDEPIDIVLHEANDQLIDSLLEAVAGSPDPTAALVAGFTAWRNWGNELGDMLRPLYAELHDARSPAAAHRKRTLSILGRELVSLVERLGRPRPSRLQVDTLLSGMEYLGFRYQLETMHTEKAWKQTRDMMLRLGLAVMGGRPEWTHAAQLADALKIELEPKD